MWKCHEYLKRDAFSKNMWNKWCKIPPQHTKTCRWHVECITPPDDMWSRFQIACFSYIDRFHFSPKKEKMSKPVKQHVNISEQKGRCDEMFVYMLKIYHVPFLMSTQHIYCIKCIIKNSVVFHAALLLLHIMYMHP